MPDNFLLDILSQAKVEVEKTLNLTDDEIQKEALSYFKLNKKRILRAFIDNDEHKKRLVCTAGASGAGKSEFVKSLNNTLKLNTIDTDEIRKIFPYYSGANASLFQRASIKVVEYLLDYLFKHNLAFVLDTNLASFEVASKNIQRAIKREYMIDIYFIYRNYKDCKHLTITREKAEGRVVSDEVFVNKAKGSLNSFLEVVEQYHQNQNITLSIIDLDKSKIYTDNLKEVLVQYSQNLTKYLTGEN